MFRKPLRLPELGGQRGATAPQPHAGLRLPDDTAQKDKRFPFNAAQLRAIFDAPPYRGFLDGGRRYAKPGDERSRNARFWMPLIGLHTGIRLNQISALHKAISALTFSDVAISYLAWDAR